jgi:hypothetical protein
MFPTNPPIRSFKMNANNEHTTDVNFAAGIIPPITRINPMALFFKRYDEVQTEIPYNPKWENGTGYLDYIVKDEAPQVEIGAAVKCITPLGRKILIVGTRLGNVAVFQRYNNREDLLVCHTHQDILEVGLPFDGNLVTEERLNMILGYWHWSPNIGQMIEKIRGFNPEA